MISMHGSEQSRNIDTWYMYAALAKDVYSSHETPIIGGWNFVANCPKEFQKHGYFGRYYWKQLEDYNGHPVVYLVISHRGTANWTDDYEDLKMVINENAPEQVAMALQFTEHAISATEWQTYTSRRPGGRLVIRFTGHSLGSISAEICHIMNASTCGDLKTRTFESPGSKPFLPSEGKNLSIPTRNSILMCPADVDAINTVLEQIATVIAPRYVGYSYPKNSAYGYPVRPNFAYYFWDFTVGSQHGIDNFYAYWKARPHVKADLSQTPEVTFPWPIGLKSSMQYWLNYCPYGQVEHKEYWSGYVKVCWANHPEIHKYYDNDIAKFRQDFITNVLRHDYGQVMAAPPGTALPAQHRFFVPASVPVVPIQAAGHDGHVHQRAGQQITQEDDDHCCMPCVFM